MLDIDINTQYFLGSSQLNHFTGQAKHMRNSKLVNLTCRFIALIFLCHCSALLAETIWIDVRSKIEYMANHIDGDLRVTHTDIVEEVTKLYADKETDIALYCAAGVRAEKAKKLLLDAGYVNVSNIGGINDAKQLRNITD